MNGDVVKVLIVFALASVTFVWYLSARLTRIENKIDRNSEAIRTLCGKA